MMPVEVILACPYCGTQEVELEEAGFIGDEMEAFSCPDCDKTFTVLYQIYPTAIYPEDEG